MKVTQLVKISSLTFVLILAFGAANAQSRSAGVNVAMPNDNAVLHLASPDNDQGLLIPALTTAQRTTLGTTLSGSSDDNHGLIVFDSEENAFYFWNGSTSWTRVANTNETVLANILTANNNAGGNAIVNVADPVNAQDVATKNYVDSQADSDNQNLTQVLGEGNSAGNNSITDLADPTNAQDAATRNYVDNIDLTSNTDATITGDGVGTPLGVNVGTGANQIVQLDGTGSLPAVDGSALTGIAASSVAANSITTVEIADGTITDADVSDVASSKVSGLGTAATLDVGTGANQIVQLDGTGLLPALDGSALTGITTTIAANTITNTELAADAVTSANIVDATITDLDINDVDASKVTGLGTAATLDVGTAGNQVVQLDATGALPAVDGSALTGVAATIPGNSITNVELAPATVTNTELATDAVLSGNIADGTIVDADINDVAAGKVTGLGTAATLDVGTGANQIVQLDAGAALPALDGSALTGVSTTIAAGSITNTQLAANAILSSTILDDEIVDADINATANIAASKLENTVMVQGENVSQLTNDAGYLIAVTSADITNNEIVDADINTAANIAATKLQGTVMLETENVSLLTNDAGYLAAGANVSTLTNDAGYLGSGANISTLTNDAGYLTAVTSADITNDEIVDADINTAANIAATKLQGTVMLETENVSLLTNDAGYIGSGANISTLTNDAGYLTAVTSADITNDEIVDADINTAANIAATKLQGTVMLETENVSLLTNDAGYIGSGANISTLTNDAGYLTAVTSANITDNEIVDADISGTANINAAKLGTGVVDNAEFNNLNGLDQSLATTDNVQFNQIAGTLVTAAQPNINSVGTLSALTVSGVASLVGNVNLGDAATDRVTVDGQLLGANPLTFQGGTDNANTTTLAIANPSGANTITLPDASGEVLLSGGALSNSLALTTDGTGAIVTADDAQPFSISSNTMNLGNAAGDQVVVAGTISGTSNNTGALVDFTNSNTGTGSSAAFTSAGTNPVVSITHSPATEPSLQTNTGIVIGDLPANIAGALRFDGGSFEANIDGSPTGWFDIIDVNFPLSASQTETGPLLTLGNTDTGTGNAASLTSAGTNPVLSITHSPATQPGIQSNTGVVIGDLPADIAGAIRFNGGSFEGNTDGSPGGWIDFSQANFQMGVAEDPNTVAFGSTSVIASSPGNSLQVIDDVSAGGATLSAATVNPDLVSNRSSLALVSARGITASPTDAVATGDFLGEIAFLGHDGSGVATGLNAGAEIRSNASETWSGAGNGTSMSFATTLNGTTGTVERLRIRNNGNVVTTGGDFVIEGDGLNARSIVFTEGNAGTGEVLGFKAPDDIINTPVIWVLPDGDGTSGQVLSTDGASNLGWTDAGLTLPYSQAQAENAAPLFYIENSGTNEAARFSVSNVTSTATTLVAESVGASGSFAFLADQSGDGGAAGIQITNATNTDDAMFVTTAGLGGVANFSNSNASNVQSVISASTNGSVGSTGVYAVNTGDGVAGEFQIVSVGNSEAALVANTDGTGHAAFFQQNNAGAGAPAVVVQHNGIGPAIGLNGAIEFAEGQPADIIVQDNNTGAGNTLSIQAGSSTSTGGDAGGDLFLSAGLGDGAAGGGPGGNVFISAGDAGGGANPAGNIFLTPGVVGSIPGQVLSEGEFVITGDGSFARPLVLANQDGTGSFGFKAQDDATANILFELPDGDGGPGQVLETDGGGNLDWVNQGLTLPLTETDASAGTGTASFNISNTGTGAAARFSGASGPAVELNGEMRFLSGNDGNLGVQDNPATDGNALNLFAGSASTSGFGGWVNINAGSGNGSANGNINLVAGYNGTDADGRILMQGPARFSHQDPSVSGRIQLGNNIDQFAIEIAADPGMTADYSVVMPQNQGTGALTNDGSGNLTWTNPNPFTSIFEDNGDNLIFGTSVGAVFPSTSPNYQLGAVAPGGQAAVSASSFGGTSEFRMTRANGSEAAPTAIGLGDSMGEITFVARHGGAAYAPGATIRAESTENWTGAGTTGSALSFQTVPQGTGSQIEIMRLQDNVVTLDADIQMREGAARTISVANNPAAIGDDLYIAAGSTTNPGSDGGLLQLRSGDGSGAGNGGNIRIEPGNGTTRGGIDLRGITRIGQVSGTSSGRIELEDNIGSSSIGINAHPTSANYNIVLPQTQGTGALTNDGAGNLTWASSGFTAPTFDDADNIIFGSVSAPLSVPGGDAQLATVVDGGAGQATLGAYSFQNRSQLALVRANGNEGAPTALAFDEVIGDVGFMGHNGVSFSTPQASIRGITTEAWTGAQRGAALSFLATVTSTGALTEMMRIEDNVLSFDGDIDLFQGGNRIISIEDNTTVAGDNLDIAAGSTTSAGFDGGILNLRGGNGSGAGNGGNIRLEPGVGTANGGIDMRGVTRFGQAGGTLPGAIELEDNGGANAIGIRAHGTSSAYNIILPQNQGTGALTNDGVGNLSWAAADLNLPYTDSDAVTTAGSASFTIQNTSTGAAARFDAASGPALELIGDIEMFTGGARAINVGPNPGANGDNLSISAGNTTNAGSNGGSLFLNAGDGSGAGNGGNIVLTPGVGTASGNISLLGAVSASGNINIGSGNLILQSTGGIQATAAINANAASITTGVYQISGTTVITAGREFRPNTIDVNTGNLNVTATGDLSMRGNFTTIPAAATGGTFTVTSRVMPFNSDVTDLDPGVEGQEVILIATGGGLTVMNTANIRLNGGVDFTGITVNSTVQLIFYNGAWNEVSRNLQP